MNLFSGSAVVRMIRLSMAVLSLCGFGLAFNAYADSVWVVGPPVAQVSGAALDFEKTLVAELQQQALPNRSVLRLQTDSLRASAPPPSLVVALGSEALLSLAQPGLGLLPNTPVLCVLMSQQTYETTLKRFKAMASQAKDTPLRALKWTALYANQPLSRQLALLRLALPKAQNLGVLWPLETADTAEGAALSNSLLELKQVTIEQRLNLRIEMVQAGAPAYKPLSSLLGQVDVLWALPNDQIYNPASFQNILLSSIRAGVPMVGFSAAYVRSGAMLGVYATPQPMARQAAHMVRDMLVDGHAAGAAVAPQFPKAFEVGVNQAVARSLGYTLDAAQLQIRLEALERAP